MRELYYAANLLLRNVMMRALRFAEDETEFTV